MSGCVVVDMFNDPSILMVWPFVSIHVYGICRPYTQWSVKVFCQIMLFPVLVRL